MMTLPGIDAIKAGPYRIGDYSLGSFRWSETIVLALQNKDLFQMNRMH